MKNAIAGYYWVKSKINKDSEWEVARYEPDKNCLRKGVLWITGWDVDEDPKDYEMGARIERSN